MNITKETEFYLEQHPSIKDALTQGVVNYSKLARKIQEERGIKNFEAVVIASRRYRDKIKKKSHLLEKRIISILKRSKLEIKNKVMVVVLEKSIYHDSLIELEKHIKKQNDTYHMIQGTGTVTVITSDSYLEKIEERFRHKIVKVTKGLVEVALKTEESVEETPGWVAYLTTLLAQNNINMIETLSAWTDTIFVIEEKDLSKLLELTKMW